MRRFDDARVAAVFGAYPPGLRTRLMALREMVFDTAARTAGVGRLGETLKWGQPSYLTVESGSGSTVRIDRRKGRDDAYAVYFHCRSGLIGAFREIYPDSFVYEGERALVFGMKDRVPVLALRHCLALALTHHARKKAAKTP